MHTLTHLRDFMDEETLRNLPGNLRSANFIILRQNKEVEETAGKKKINVSGIVLQVFDKNGNWIGCIEHPDYIPNQEQ